MEYGDEFAHCDAPDSVDSEDGGQLLKFFSPNYVFNAQLSLLNLFSLNLSLYMYVYMFKEICCYRNWVHLKHNF